MKRDFLEGLGLEKDVIDKIMDENGADIQREKQAAQNAKADADALRQQLEDRDEDLETLRKNAGNTEDIQKRLDELQEKYDTDTQNYKDQLSARDYADAMSQAISGASLKFSSKGAERAFRAELKAKGLTLKDGALEGFDDFVKAQREADPDAFAPDKPGPKFVRPGGGVGGNEGATNLGIKFAERIGKDAAAANKAAADVINIYK